MNFFNKLKNAFTGLMRDDCLRETPPVAKALERLPEHLVDERNFRIIRALQLSCQKIVLPKEQWTKYEEVRKTNKY